MFDYYYGNSSSEVGNSMNTPATYKVLQFAAYKEAYKMVGSLLSSFTKLFTRWEY